MWIHVAHSIAVNVMSLDAICIMWHCARPVLLLFMGCLCLYKYTTVIDCGNSVFLSVKS
jgi:hypothetical protein